MVFIRLFKTENYLNSILSNIIEGCYMGIFTKKQEPKEIDLEPSDMDLFKAMLKQVIKPKEKHIDADSLKVEVPNMDFLMKKFEKKLDSIEKEITQMRIIMFEMTNGKYNPFKEAIEPENDDISEIMKAFNKKLADSDSDLNNFLLQLNSDTKIRRTESTVPNNKGFKFHDGSIANNLEDLYNHLKELEKEHYEKHVSDSKNDFADWIKSVLGNEDLASSVLSSKSKEDSIEHIKQHLK